MPSTPVLYWTLTSVFRFVIRFIGTDLSPTCGVLDLPYANVRAARSSYCAVYGGCVVFLVGDAQALFDDRLVLPRPICHRAVIHPDASIPEQFTGDEPAHCRVMARIAECDMALVSRDLCQAVGLFQSTLTAKSAAVVDRKPFDR